MTTHDSSPVLRGKHVLMIMLAMFGTIIAVNAVFIYLAVGTFTGVTSANPFQEGLAYNEVLAARDAQRALGWQSEVAVTRLDSEADRITLRFSDAAGQALTGLTLSGALRRPTHAGMDQLLAWQEAGPGRYEAEVRLPARGNWDLVTAADDGRNHPFALKTRLWFK